MAKPENGAITTTLQTYRQQCEQSGLAAGEPVPLSLVLYDLCQAFELDETEIDLVLGRVGTSWLRQFLNTSVSPRRSQAG